MNTESTRTDTRAVAMYGLAVTGFLALVVAGIWLAVYSTRFVPGVVNNVGAAAVYLGSLFVPSDGAILAVVPTASTTISFGEPAVPSTSVTPAATTRKTKPVAGPKTTSVQQISGASATLYGLPDLVVSINVIGYLATNSPDSFIEASSVPPGMRPAVSFTIKNIGTNTTGSWRFSASIPTQTAYIYQSKPEDTHPLAPGESIDYVLGFDQSNKGNQTISITADFDNAVNESNNTNNSASVNITVQ